METSTSRKAILWIAVVFVFGLALGGVGGYYVSHRIYAAPAPQTDEAKRAHRVEQLTDELNLTSAQQQRLGATGRFTSNTSLRLRKCGKRRGAKFARS